MAEYTAEQGDIGVYGKTLTPNTVDTVVFPGHMGSVEITKPEGTPIHYTLDGSTPTVGGGNTHKLPACFSVRVLPNPTGEAPTKVRLISAGAIEYDIAKAGSDS